MLGRGQRYADDRVEEVGRFEDVTKMLSGIDAKDCINENSLPLDADGGVKVLSENTGYDDNFQNVSEDLKWFGNTICRSVFSPLSVFRLDF